MLNTIKSMLRFYGSVIRKYSPLKPGDGSIEDVVNYISYNDSFSSSGQPLEQQFRYIRDAGYSVVINLAPYDFMENPLKGEEKTVHDLGMKYYHIPVNMQNPTQEKFDVFAETMQQSSGKKVWVHCAVNLRASAFSYRYRCTVLGVDEETAIWDLREIWEPFGAWKSFLFNSNEAVLLS